MFDWKKVQHEKDRRRSQAAAFSFVEKLAILERLRDRQQQLSRLKNRRKQESRVASNIRISSATGSAEGSASGTRLFIIGADAGLLAALTQTRPASATATRHFDNSGASTGTGSDAFPAK